MQTLDLALALRDSAATVVGGFQSPVEQECLEILLRGERPVIVCPARSVEDARSGSMEASHRRRPGADQNSNPALRTQRIRNFKAIRDGGPLDLTLRTTRNGSKMPK